MLMYCGKGIGNGIRILCKSQRIQNDVGWDKNINLSRCIHESAPSKKTTALFVVQGFVNEANFTLLAPFPPNLAYLSVLFTQNPMYIAYGADHVMNKRHW